MLRRVFGHDRGQAGPAGEIDDVGHKNRAGIERARRAAVPCALSARLYENAHAPGERRKANCPQGFAHRLIVGFHLGINVGIVQVKGGGGV